MMFQGFRIYETNPFSLSEELLKKKPKAIIFTKASMVNKTVKQLSRYPTKIINADYGSASGLSMTKVMELIKIKSKMMPSKILAVKFLFLLAADFLVSGFDVLREF